jgi:predicted nucleic acid-binding protein
MTDSITSGGSGLIVLDTNVVSAAMRDDWPASARNWFLATRGRHALTAVTLTELVYGIHRLPEGTRRKALTDTIADLIAQEATLVLGLTAEAAVAAGSIRARREARGRPMSLADAQIAGICHVEGADLATRNARDFADVGIHVIDPWAL